MNGYDVSLVKKLGDNGEHCTFLIKNRNNYYSFNIIITKWPTGNCQLASIGYVNTLIYQTNYNNEDIRAIIKHCYSLINLVPKLAIIDVPQSLCSHVELCFKNIRNKHLYISTNFSQMCLYLVQVDSL